MPREPPPKSWTANRRGCFLIAAVLAALVALLLYIGLRARPEDALNSVMRIPGAFVAGAACSAIGLTP
jgi:hypothetical protein